MVTTFLTNPTTFLPGFASPVMEVGARRLEPLPHLNQLQLRPTIRCQLQRVEAAGLRFLATVNVEGTFQYSKSTRSRVLRSVGFQTRVYWPNRLRKPVQVYLLQRMVLSMYLRTLLGCTRLNISSVLSWFHVQRASVHFCRLSPGLSSKRDISIAASRF